MRRGAEQFWQWVGPLAGAGLLLLGLRLVAPTLPLDRTALLLGLVVPTSVIGLVAAGIWWGRRSEGAFFWLAMSCFWGCLYSLPRVIDPGHLSETWVPVWSLGALGAYIASSVILGKHLFARDWPGFETALFLFVVVLTLVAATTAGLWPQALPVVAVWLYGLLVAYGFTLNLLIYVVEHLQRPTALSFVMQLTAHSMGATVLWEFAQVPDGSLWFTPSWFLLMAPLAVVVVTAWLLQRFGQALGEAERWADTLELRVAEREAEIAASYTRLREAEQASAIASERERLFRDMHDGLGGTLVLTLSRLINEGAADTPVARALQSALDDLRLILSSLTPGGASLRSGLGDLRGRLQDTAEDRGVQLEVDLSGVPDSFALGPSLLLQTLRILQEACVNSLRHADARCLRIRAAVLGDGMRSGRLQIQVEDDGCGFDPARPAGAGHYGLINQRQRALQIGAQLGFERLSPGMRMTLLLPVS